MTLTLSTEIMNLGIEGAKLRIEKLKNWKIGKLAESQ
jgi:hypothetical protein